MDFSLLVALLGVLVGVPTAVVGTYSIIDRYRDRKTSKANSHSRLTQHSELPQDSRDEKLPTSTAKTAQNEAGSVQPKASGEQVEVRSGLEADAGKAEEKPLEQRVTESSMQTPSSQANGLNSDGNRAPNPSFSSIDTDALYREVMGALAGPDPDIHNIDRAIYPLQELLRRDPTFEKDRLAVRMAKLLRRQTKKGSLEYQIAMWQRVLIVWPEDRKAQHHRLRLQANVARREGDWEREVDTWQQVLTLWPEDREAKRRLKIAKQNRDCGAEQYKLASEMKDVQTKKYLLNELWRKLAPNYGDPGKLLEQMDIHDPLENIPFRGWRRIVYACLLYWMYICTMVILSAVLYLLLPWGHQNSLFGNNIEAVLAAVFSLVMAIICFISFKILTKRFLL